jgi:hypothetical protein
LQNAPNAKIQFLFFFNEITSVVLTLCKFQEQSSQDFFRGCVFNPLHMHAKKIVFKRFKSPQILHFLMKKMCKAHFHPFAVIIFLFQTVGIQWGGSKFTFKEEEKMGAPTPPLGVSVGRPLRHLGENTGNTADRFFLNIVKTTLIS